MKTFIPPFLPATATLALATLITGCGTTHKMKPSLLGDYSSAARIPLSVELRMPKEYREGAHLVSVYNDKYLYGAHLALNTERCAQSTFSRVTVTSAPVAAAVTPGNDALLIPEVVNVDVIIPGGGAAKIVTTFALQWSLFDQHRDLVWVDTLKTESRGDIGVSTFKPFSHMQKRFDIMFQDVIQQSQKAMLSSPEIQQLAERVQNERIALPGR